MSEFEQYLDQFNKSLEKSRESYRNGLSYLKAAESWYKTLCQTREAKLRNTLKEKELAVCSDLHYVTMSYNPPEEWRKKSAEELGIYPRNQMRLSYDQGVTSDTDHFTMSTSEYRVISVLLLCPEHFSQTILGLYGTKEVPRLSSEVIQKDGRFTLAVNGADITELINRGGRDIEPDGKIYPDPAVYRYLGIPDLPQRPDIDAMKFNR